MRTSTATDRKFIDERQLSLAVGVSRTPTREAMTLLEQEGFLRTVPRRGIFIVRKTKKEIIEVCAALASMAGEARHDEHVASSDFTQVLWSGGRWRYLWSVGSAHCAMAIDEEGKKR